MSDRDVLTLLDRAVAGAPPLHLEHRAVVARGRQVARRRRGTRVGMALAVATFAGTVWLGLGGQGTDLRTMEVSPASVSWEAEGPTTLTLLDGVPLGGDVYSLRVTKDGDRVTGAFKVDGVEETVEGTTMAGGADVLVGARATVVLWDHPARALPDIDLFPAPPGQGYGSGGQAGQDDVFYYVTTDAGYVPTDLVFRADDGMWTAGGEVAETARLVDGSVEVTAFSLPGLGLGGFLDGDGARPTYLERGTVLVSGHVEPWWRGGDDLTTYLYRLPPEARWVRPVLDRHASPRVVGEPAATTGVGDSAFALSALSTDDMADAAVWGDAEWSTDGRTWHRTGEEPHDPGAAGPLEEGSLVRLLGEDYEVAVDARGWPTLVGADGSSFLSVTDEEGPSDGGVVMWRDHWWPWSDRNTVHFYVGWEPPAGAEVLVQGEEGTWFEPEDVVTVAGPEGVVTLVAIPAGGMPVTGLGLRTDEGVRPVSPGSQDAP